MNATDQFRYSDRMSTGQAADYLVDLAHGIRDGALTLHGQENTITIVPENTVKLEVKAKQKEGKGELELEVSWKEKYIISTQKLEINPGKKAATGNHQ